MEELPEKNTPPSRPEDQDPTTENASAPEPLEGSQETNPAADAGPQKSRPKTAQAQEAPAESTTEQESLATAEKPGEALGNESKPAGDNEPNPVAEGAPTQDETPSPASAETEAPAPEVESPAPQPEPAPAAETAAPAAAQAEAPAGLTEEPEQAPAPAEEEQAPLGEVEITPSGAVKVPGAEDESTVAASQEERPKKAPARPEKPIGPRITDLRPGQVVEGTVTRVEKYGAFVNLGLADRRDGLIHISELAPFRIRRVEDVVQVGSPVRARVVSVDLGRGRIALSLNDVEEGSAREASAGPSEPALTSMAAAFQEAQTRRREQERASAAEGRVGDKKRREQEELMRRLRGENG